jgi:cyclophilin family peptidyl-prolyl cis-trans isomerase
LLLEQLSALRPESPSVLKAAAVLSVALHADRSLLPELARTVSGAALAFAAAGCAGLPTGLEREVVLTALRSSTHEVHAEGAITDPVVARLIYGHRYGDPDLAALARDVFEAATAAESAENAPHPERLHAALFSLQRGGSRPGAEWRGLVAAWLLHVDGRVAARAARVLAMLADADVRDAEVIAAAEESGGTSSVRVERLRALGSLPLTPARGVLLKALASGDTALERAALEALASGAASLAQEDRKAFAQRALAAADRDPRREVARAAVLACAALDEDHFLAASRQWRLSRPWIVRATAASVLAGRVPEPEFVLAYREALLDCDARVVATALEGLADRLSAAGTVPTALWDMIVPRNGETPCAAFPVPEATDPVVLAQWARIATAWLKAATPQEPLRSVAAFLAAACARVPAHEVECLQSVVDLALAANATNELQRFATSAEASIRRRARAEAPNSATLGTPKLAPWASPRASLPNSLVLHTTRGNIGLELFAEDAPATVANLVHLARSGFLDGMPFHRRVPGFVAQAGCPRGDGWGGPGYTIPCEINARSYRRGSVGMALAGKDTGGSQWFLTLEDAPHLDGRYTLFGVVRSGLDVMDALTEEDQIVKVSLEAH